MLRNAYSQQSQQPEYQSPANFLTKKVYKHPKPYPNVTEIGLNAHKAERILQIERLSKEAYKKAAASANKPENFVVAESHHFRY